MGGRLESFDPFAKYELQDKSNRAVDLIDDFLPPSCWKEPTVFLATALGD